MRPRIRSIKPEIADDEALWDLGVETGLPVYQAFTMLWCCADREARFEWRPRQLKTHCLPYWDGDFSRVLDALVTRGFVVRYEVDGREYGLVRTFMRHQLINNREGPSSLPPPPEAEPSQPLPRVEHASTTREARGPSVPSVDREGIGKGSGSEGVGVVASSREPDETGVLTKLRADWSSNQTVEHFSAAREVRGLGPYRRRVADYHRLEELTDLALDEAVKRKTTPAAVLTLIFDAWFSSEHDFATKNQFQLFSLTDPGSWLATKKLPTSSKGPIAAKTAAAYDNANGANPWDL